MADKIILDSLPSTDFSEIEQRIVANHIPEQMRKEMNNFRIRFYKKNPKASERQCRRALMKKFNITIPNNVSTKD